MKLRYIASLALHTFIFSSFAFAAPQTREIERTLSIIKPDATRRNLTGVINSRFEQAGLKIIAQKRMLMTQKQAERFYKVHKNQSFFKELCNFMVSGPVVVQVLQGDHAVQRNREIMGATNPASAAEGTIRRDFGGSIGENSVHGSDSLDNATQEISYFFAEIDIIE